MTGRPRCEEPKALRRSRRRGAVSTDLGARPNNITPVCQATSLPDSGLARPRQADEGGVSPTADGRKREASPTASRYYLRNSRNRACTRDTRTGPGVRPATSPAKVKASKTGSRREESCVDERKTGDGRSRTTRPPQPTSETKEGKKKKQMELPKRPKRREVQNRLLSSREVQRFGTWNVCTLRGLGKTEHLAEEMKRYRLSILAVTETHLTGEGEMLLDEESGYTMFFSGRQDGHSREGVGLALSPYARAAMRHHHAVSARILAAEFLTQVGPLQVVVAYAPTNQGSEEEKDQFYDELDCVVTRGNGRVMVMGDFNASVSEKLHGVVGIHGLEKTTSDNGERLVSFAGANSLCITNTFFPHKHIHQATWYPPDSRRHPSLKDYILVKQRMMPSILDTRVHRGGDMDSDHRLVIMSVRLKLKKKPTEQEKRYFDVELLQEGQPRTDFADTIEKCFERRKRAGDVEERWNELKTSILESAEEHLKRKRKKKKRWISEDTMKIIEAKRKAFLQWQECRTNVEKQKEYWKYRKRVRRAVKKDREKWLDTMMKEMEDSLKRHRQGDFYKKLRQLNVSRVKPTTTILDESGKPLHTNEKKMARWRRHFEGVLNVRNAVTEDVIAEVEDLSGSDTPELTREEVEKAVKKLRNGKAAGSDHIVAELLKNGGEAMINWLWELLKEVWKTKQVPKEWKKAILIPLHKKKSRRLCDNYRGIALLSIPGKVLSLVLLYRLQTIIDPQLLESQCGFRKGRGIIDQIWVARQIVERAVEYQTPAHLCFVDLTKAYDSVDRSALIAILKSYKVPHHLTDIIREMYTETWCQVRTTEGCSEDFKVESGVRQGCVLSPLLFNCVMDKILRETMEMSGGGWNIEYTTTGGLFLTYRDKTPATTCIRNVQYADDLTLVAETAKEMQHMVDELDRACTRWGMAINGTKTKVLNRRADGQSASYHTEGQHTGRSRLLFLSGK